MAVKNLSWIPVPRHIWKIQSKDKNLQNAERRVSLGDRGTLAKTNV